MNSTQRIAALKEAYRRTPEYRRNGGQVHGYHWFNIGPRFLKGDKVIFEAADSAGEGEVIFSTVDRLNQHVVKVIVGRGRSATLHTVIVGKDTIYHNGWPVHLAGFTPADFDIEHLMKINQHVI